MNRSNRAKTANVIQLKNVWKTYSMNEKIEVQALRGVNLSISPGEFISIVGPSGSGKSTLLHLLGCLDAPTRGQVLFGNRSVSQMKDSELTEIRCRKIGFIFQTFNLLPTLSALGNVEIAMRLAGRNKIERRKRAEKLLRKMGLEKRMYHLPRELSIGERQRVAIARALANNPELILADEPTGNLDSVTAKEIVALLRRINAEGETIVMVTHNLEIAKLAGKIYRMKDGKCSEHG